jgi:hypothetical protein
MLVVPLLTLAWCASQFSGKRARPKPELERDLYAGLRVAAARATAGDAPASDTRAAVAGDGRSGGADHAA